MPWWTRVGWLAVLGMVGPGCTGIIDDPASSDAPDRGSVGAGGPTLGADGSFRCDPEDPASASPLRRLSALQYRNTLRDLFAPYGVDPLAEAEDAIDRVPVDDAGSSFRITDTRLSDQHVRAYFRVSDRLASAVTTEDARLVAVAGDCALEAAPGAACIDRFLDDFAMRALRRPLTAEERARYHALDDGSRDGRELFRALVLSVLMAPSFLYHVELEGETLDGDEVYYELGPYELASRLSYHFWQSMPDDALLAAAADGTLGTDEGYAEQARRVFEDPRTQDALQAFYAEWFRLGTLTGFADTEGFRTFAEGTTVGDPDADHARAMSAEIEAMTAHFTWEAEGSMRDLLLTDLSFTRSPHLAALYGVEPWDGASEPPRLPAEERAGILTRAAFLATGTHETHPVHRGATVRRRILCNDLPSPDPAVLPDGALTPPPVTADQTTRERYANKTANEPCASCHALMNPIGYVLEQYDALGRHRTHERVIDEVSGEELAVLPIDSTAAPRIELDDPSVMSTGPELSRAVADSGMVEACFARQYFRFAFAREERAGDGCALERIRSSLDDGGTLQDALISIAFDPSFRTRRVR